ncbi:hypothetical protein KSS87_011692 [Heliosperma pusillum]|nr:hypothetical protein KSS87_011692 [Heliosperma pusillum]
MGYVLRVRLASFFAGTAVASTAGLYVLYHDYKLAHLSLSDQGTERNGEGERGVDSFPSSVSGVPLMMLFIARERKTMKRLHDSLDKRVSALEKVKEAEVPQQHPEAIE